MVLSYSHRADDGDGAGYDTDNADDHLFVFLIELSYLSSFNFSTKTFNAIFFVINTSACDERVKDGFVHATVLIKGLKTSTSLTLDGLLPKLVKNADNATVDVEITNW